MRNTIEKHGILLLLFAALLGSTFGARATPECEHPTFYVQGCDYPNLVGPAGPTGPTGATGPSGPPGPQGLPGADASVTGLATVSSVETVQEQILLNDNRLVGGIASVAAIGMIPDAMDGHTAIGVGFTNYRGVEGLAIGITHKVDHLNLRAAVSTSSAERDAVIGFGASASF